MDDENIVEFNGEKIDISKLSDEELLELHKMMKQQEGLLEKKIKQYKEKYPFLNDENDERD